MTYVVTQACCADASCVVACPVNCIHPAPGEPGFATAEMLYVDANSCVGCGACATACPVDAIKPDTKLRADEQPFVAINADYYDCFPHLDRRPLATVVRQRRLARPGPYRVAVVGAGPAGLYTADELLKHPEVSVDVYDRLPTPHGLVRAGVAPDHPHTKHVETLFRAIEDLPGFRYFLNVEVGRDVTLAELEAQYHAVVYSVGASSDRALDVSGEELPGSLAATDVVGWYNAHPDKQALDVPLGHERAVVVGNGNVALDVARILTAAPEALERTDIASQASTALRHSKIREVVVLGRRGPAEGAFTVPELVGLAGIPDVDVVVDTGGVPIGALVDTIDPRGLLLADLATRRRTPGRRAIVLRFLTAPVRILGEDSVSGLEVERTRLAPDEDGRLVAVGTGQREILETGLVIRSVGYHGRPVAALPYDAATGTVPHDRGRVRPGVYVAGWVKRGPTGFIGTNKSCAQESVERLLDDLDAEAVTAPVGTSQTVAAVVAGRRPEMVDLAGWRTIDAEERRRGSAQGRPRVKLVDVDEMVWTARTVQAAQVPRRRPSRRRYASLRERLDQRGLGERG